ncbi:MAG: FliO/MopB family protein [Mariprofundaceae bacterium]
MPSTLYAAEPAGFGDTGLAPLFLKSMGGLALVLALFACLVWLAKRLKLPVIPASSNDTLRMVKRLAVSGRHSVMVIEYEGQRWLIGVSPQNIDLLGEIDINKGQKKEYP